MHIPSNMQGWHDSQILFIATEGDPQLMVIMSLISKYDWSYYDQAEANLYIISKVDIIILVYWILTKETLNLIFQIYKF